MKPVVCSAAAVVLAALSVLGCAADQKAIADEQTSANTKQASTTTLVERGKYLADAVGCQDCHSPKIFSPEGIPHPDESRAYSGHPGGQAPPFDKRALTPGNWYAMSPDLTAYVGPWGVSYAMNITPDEQTGIGLWTEDVFIQALRTGKHMGNGRPILPPMPWYYYATMTDDDLRALFAYLKSLPPIKNVVPQPIGPGDAAAM